MNVVPFPVAPLRPPRLDLLSHVFAAMALVGEPATACELAEVIATAIAGADRQDVERQVGDILRFYERATLPAPIEGRVFRRIGEGYAYTLEFRTLLAMHADVPVLREAIA
jgi:hypothetical protein